MAVNNDVILNKNIPVTSSVQVTAPITTASTPVDVTAQSSNDTLTTGNSQGTPAQTKRSVEQLYQAIQGLCTSNGIDFNDVKKIGLLSTVSGKNEETLLNAEQEEITKLVKLIEETIAEMKEDGIELTAENLEKQARGYQIQLACGWDSIASFRKRNKQNHDSVITRLNKFFNCDFENLSTEEKAEKLDAYFNRYFNGADSKETIRTKQLTDFSKLLYNSTPEERLVLKDAIEFLCANNRYKGFDSILRSFDTDAQRTEFANNVSHENIQSIGTRIDRAGDVTAEEDVTAITAALMKYKDAEHVTEYHGEAQKARSEFFTEENIAKLDAIKTKVENGEELTEDEQALLQEANFHTSDTAGEIVGVGNNEVVSKDFRNKMLETLNADAYTNPNYREVLNQVNKYIEKHPECLTISKEKFIAKMNEVTNGNFDKVVSNSPEPLKAPEVKQETPSTPSNNQPSLTAADIEEYRASITARNAQLAAQSSESDNVETKAEKFENPQWTRAKICTNPLKYIRECYGSKINEQNLILAFNRTSETLQSTILSLASGSTFNLFLNEASNSVVLNTEKGRTSYQTQLLKEKREEIEEQMT